MLFRKRRVVTRIGSGKGIALDRSDGPRSGESWPRAVIFDLDGTLVDSAGDIASALNEVLGRRDLPPIGLEKVKEMIGGGIPALIKRALQAHGVQPHDIELLVADMVGVYAGRATALTTLYDGAEDVLNQLGGSGVKMAVCTNKLQEITDIILRDLGVAGHFASVIGAKLGRPRKPDPEVLKLALDEMGLGAADAIMVGDSGADAGAAKGAGVTLVLASFGYCQTPLSEFEPDAIIDSFHELPRTLETLARHRGS
jgi:phosphoglycolate phosphatase